MAGKYQHKNQSVQLKRSIKWKYPCCEIDKLLKRVLDQIMIFKGLQLDPFAHKPSCTVTLNLNFAIQGFKEFISISLHKISLHTMSTTKTNKRY